MNYSETYHAGTQILSDAGISEAALDARLLLEFITGEGLNTLLAHPDTSVSAQNEERYKKILEKRAQHIPLSYLTGESFFMGIRLGVNENVLIPRQDSECLVEEAMRYVEDASSVLDLCTGSGCLLLALMHYKNNISGIGVDISDKAVKTAVENAAHLEAEGALNGGKAEFFQGDLYDALASDAKFEYMISNPPYIRSGIIPTLMPEVRDHEPHIALDGGEDGLDIYRRIAQGAHKHLRKHGMIFLEIGYDQSEDVTAVLDEYGFTDITTIKDYCDNDRVITAKMK